MSKLDCLSQNKEYILLLYIARLILFRDLFEYIKSYLRRGMLKAWPNSLGILTGAHLVQSTNYYDEWLFL